jgi:transglutaminase-like putative cysteine protease
MPRWRPALLALVPAIVIAQNWLRLERPERGGGRALLLVVLALTPAVAPRLWQRLVVLFGIALVAAKLAVRVSPIEHAHLHRHFFSLVASRIWNGILDFYDVRLPFDPFFHPDMHAVLLVAAFGFAAAFALAVASQRPLAAVLVLLAGAGWPATLLSDGRDLTRGAVILAAALILLAGFRADARRTIARAAALGAALVALSLAASTQPAVAKGEFLHWQTWDFNTRPAKSVGVRYVWDSSYDGFSFPKKVTTVFKVKAPPLSVYWRATTLDLFTGDRWVEDLRAIRPAVFAGVTDLTLNDPLDPPAAQEPARWRKAEVDIEGLADDHVVAPSVPVAYGSGVGAVGYAQGGIGIVPGGLHRGEHYDVWSYSPQPTPTQLAASKPDYPPEVLNYLDVVNDVAAPVFGAPNRAAQMEHLFQDSVYSLYFSDYRQVYEKALQVAGDTQTPYAAAVAIESWLRGGAEFTYDQHPPPTATPIVAFLTRTKRGYCQHYAGAMALMLRYLGIPARVAEGFTSGDYDKASGTWTVTDHDAHAWVEVWFKGYGWLPFDPTPGRGSLSGTYSASSARFDSAAAAALLAGAAAKLFNTVSFHQAHSFGENLDAGRGLTAADPRRAAANSAAGGGHRGGSLGKLVGLVLAVVLLFVALAKAAIRRARYATNDPRRVAAACRAELVDFLADQGIAIPASAAPRDLALELRERLEVDAELFAHAFAVARFGPFDEANAAASRARSELVRLERQIRMRVGVLRRARGVVSLRSLGFAG